MCLHALRWCQRCLLRNLRLSVPCLRTCAKRMMRRQYTLPSSGSASANSSGPAGMRSWRTARCTAALLLPARMARSGGMAIKLGCWLSCSRRRMLAVASACCAASGVPGTGTPGGTDGVGDSHTTLGEWWA